MCSSLLLLGFVWISVIADYSVGADSSNLFLGISPLDENYFKSDVIKCRDGSKSFVRARLNDGFCDCADGTDEPGTPACPEGRFFCRNSGHVPLTLFSSRVNDGICDCCDGSDEYDGKIECANTCWEAGKAARDKLRKKIATFQEGAAMRKQEVEQSRNAIAKEEAELSRLKNEEKVLKDLVEKLKEQKQKIEKAEEEERLIKEKEAQKIKEAEQKENVHINQPEDTLDAKSDEEKGNQVNHAEDTLSTKLGEKDENEQVNRLEDNTLADPDEIMEESSESVDQYVEEDEYFEDNFHHDPSDASNENSDISKDQTLPENKEDLSKEELGRLVASRWTGQHSDGQAEEVDHSSNVQENAHFDMPESGYDEEYDGYHSDGGEYDKGYSNDMDTNNVDDEEDDEEEEEEHLVHEKSESRGLDDVTDSDLSDIGGSSWWDKIQQKLKAVMESFNLFKAPLNISDASRIKKEYDDYDGKLQKVQSRISSLSEKLKADFGPEKEFYPFYDRCFENKQNKYVYKVCPFKQASQVEGHSTTRLGQWEKFEESYRIMRFSNGDRCWNGPDRSLKVKLRCGVKNELADVDEPSRCEYEALMSTPAVCLDKRLKELQDKLEAMNEGRIQTHDEL